jgi:pre-mRNA-splicing factor CDC5/CEF1
MRILIKGGVWKNTEDEILKAAVMKYGKNQWARVASLLTRKSAKQCKARWYEWLDPSIKKIEWSREEEEKLLHLAKLLPNQWRTIAPIVGRTAGQCMEHYERLLDQAQDGEAAADDPRRLRPGEIDPAPETKPARPDPIDMDEDEKEMLAEARARLANTKGKKAKRKARERQLEESRRLSSLQKRRELKAAGIETSLNSSKKRKYIDYSKEIPFHMVPNAGFYDVGDELVKEKAMKLDPATQGMELSKIEGRHAAIEEETERAKDKKRLKTLFKMNAAQAVMAVSAQNDPTTLRRRSALDLPAPQVTDAELEDIVKAGQASMMLPPEIIPSRRGGGANAAVDATSSLIGDYSSQFRSAMPTPLRTPHQENIVLQEAKNARALRDMTPFSGEELPELHEGTGFDGVTPRTAKLATPNTVLSTPGRPGAHVSGTPMVGTPGSVTSSFAGTGSVASGSSRAVRDHLRLNDSAVDSFESFSSLKAKTKEMKVNIASQLKHLPAPEYEYELAIPEVEKDDELDETAVVEEDAAEVAEKQRQDREELVRLELERRSSVLKRSLPRPATVSQAYAVAVNSQHAGAEISGEEARAKQLIREESLRLILQDEHRFPNADLDAIKAQQRTKDRYFDNDMMVTEEIEDSYMQQARDMVREEHADWIRAGQSIDEESNEGVVDGVDMDEFNRLWEDIHKKCMYIPSRGTDGRGAYGTPADKQESLNVLMTQFTALRARIEKDSKKSVKLENKLNIVTKGYSARAEKLDALIGDRFNAYWKASTDLGDPSELVLVVTYLHMCSLFRLFPPDSTQRKCRTFKAPDNIKDGNAAS